MATGPRPARAGAPRRPQGTVTGWITTAPAVGSSSVACDTPDGVMTSMALGTVAGSTEQIGLVPPAAHTPKLKSPAELA